MFTVQVGESTKSRRNGEEVPDGDGRRKKMEGKTGRKRTSRESLPFSTLRGGSVIRAKFWAMNRICNRTQEKRLMEAHPKKT